MILFILKIKKKFIKKILQVRFVCISDTHSKLGRMLHEIPAGDVLIHAGDFTSVGSLDDVEKFDQDLKKLSEKFKYIVVIAGNHELSFDQFGLENNKT
jgi:predicted phosphodiesterase